MKKFFSILAVFTLVAFAQISKAAPIANYYVVSGEPFKLTPTGGGALSKLIWTIDDVDIQEILGSVGNGVLTHTFSDATTDIKLHKISLKVLEIAGGCLSDVVEYNIVVLPKITVTITPDGETNFCSGTLPNVGLTATINTVSNLGTYGVTVSPFVWKNGATTLSETTGTLVAKAAGTYTAVVSYVLPTSGTFPSTASNLTNCVVLGTQQILNNLPMPSVPTITLN
ncbi:hypothetical protein [Dyadobacter luticola]|uniref:Uncharacterized protein n=1 Tax=Dyadobacter luticola TaxID=1979387 RepID=A0A5R9L2C2_9BACT|nr:hypothetical protein [Dyadobacter luticola]TLV02571.1 hypothetical protein FEN17_02825 [Dyadobacter luticola]